MAISEGGIGSVIMSYASMKLKFVWDWTDWISPVSEWQFRDWTDLFLQYR